MPLRLLARTVSRDWQLRRNGASIDDLNHSAPLKRRPFKTLLDVLRDYVERKIPTLPCCERSVRVGQPQGRKFRV